MKEAGRKESTIEQAGGGQGVKLAGRKTQAQRQRDLKADKYGWTGWKAGK